MYATCRINGFPAFISFVALSHHEFYLLPGICFLRLKPEIYNRKYIAK
jgi:hypothetical protein